MAQVPLQVGASGAYSHEYAHMGEVRLNSTNVAIAAGANVDVLGTVLQANPLDESLTYTLTHDGTAGNLTIELASDDLVGGPHVKLTDDALIYGGDRKTVPVGALVLDLTDVNNQGTILVAISPSARQLDANGNLVAFVQEFNRLVYTTDAGWDGTGIDEIACGCHKHHMPGPNAD